MQGLRAAKCRRHRLVGGADHVVIRVLCLQADTRRLTMGPQHFGFIRLRAEVGHDLVPE